MMDHMAKHNLEATPAEEDEKPLISRLVSIEEENNSNTDATHPERQIGDRKRNRRSSVWEFFTKVDDEVQCSLCPAKLKYWGSTTSMNYHIRSRHPDNTANDSAPLPTQTEVTQLVAKMIEKDLFPVNVVNGEGFQELFTQVARNYKIPSADEIARIIEVHFRQKTNELAMQLGKEERVALTADLWSALPFQSSLTVSCSFITEDWREKTAVLQTHSWSGSSIEGGHVTDMILSTIHTWGIAGKVTFCVHNTKSILSKPDGPARWSYIPCFATMLQLAITKGLTAGLNQIISAAGRLVSHFNSNSLANKALEQKQVQMCLPQNKLIQSSQAHWDTICDMLERLLEQRWAIKAVLSDRSVTSREDELVLEFEDDYWQIVENITPVLATLRWAETVVSAETEISISNTHPITFSLIQTHLAPKPNDFEQVWVFKEKVRQSLQEYMEIDSSQLASNPALIASMLDPRHKHLSFLTPSERLAAKVKLHELVAQLDAASASAAENTVTPNDTQVPTWSQLRRDPKNTMMLLLGDSYSFSYGSDAEAQVDYYLRDITPTLDTNPLDWWRVNAQRFPKLATLARHYLCIPSTTLPSLLSDSGRNFAKMRMGLCPEDVNMMIFVNRNNTMKLQ